MKQTKQSIVKCQFLPLGLIKHLPDRDKSTTPVKYSVFAFSLKQGSKVNLYSAKSEEKKSDI